MIEKLKKQLQDAGFSDEDIAKILSIHKVPESVEDLPEALRKQIQEEEKKKIQNVETETERIITNQFRDRLSTFETQIAELKSKTDQVDKEKAEKDRLAKEEAEKKAKEEEKQKPVKERVESLESAMEKKLAELESSYKAEIETLRAENRRKDIEAYRKDKILEYGLEDFSELIPDTQVNPAIDNTTLDMFIEKAKQIKSKYVAEDGAGNTSPSGDEMGQLPSAVKRPSRPVLEPSRQEGLSGQNKNFSRKDLRRMSAEDIEAMIESEVPIEPTFLSGR